MACRNKIGKANQLLQFEFVVFEQAVGGGGIGQKNFSHDLKNWSRGWNVEECN